MQLKGKKAIITGGSGGIGAAIVRAFVREGAIVSSMDVQDELGEKIVEDANEGAPGRGKYFHCDVSSSKEVERVFEQAIVDMGGLDILANLAAVARVCNAEDISEEQLDWVLGIVFKGTVFTNQAAFKAMKNHGGVILNFGSDSALVSTPMVADYSGAKGAVISWTRSISHEWAKYNIRANSIVPAMETHGGKKVTAEVPAEAVAALKAMIPLGRLGNPDEEMAPVMVFLANDAARYITGQIIAVNGGFSMVR